MTELLRCWMCGVRLTHAWLDYYCTNPVCEQRYRAQPLWPPKTGVQRLLGALPVDFLLSVVTMLCIAVLIWGFIFWTR